MQFKSVKVLLFCFVRNVSLCPKTLLCVKHTKNNVINQIHLGLRPAYSSKPLSMTTNGFQAALCDAGCTFDRERQKHRYGVSSHWNEDVCVCKHAISQR